MRRHRQAKGNEVFTRRKQKCVLSNVYQNGKSNGTSVLVFLDHAFISIMASRCGRSSSRVQQYTVSVDQGVVLLPGVDYRQCTVRMQLSACTRVQHTCPYAEEKMTAVHMHDAVHIVSRALAVSRAFSIPGHCA